MAAFASVEYLTSHWRPLTPEESALAGNLLEESATWLRAFVDVNPEDENQAALLESVNARMTRRAMEQNAASPYTLNEPVSGYGWQPQAQAGEWFLKRDEKRALGIGEVTIAAVRL